MRSLAARWVLERPDAPALHAGAQTWSWTELDLSARRWASWLDARGLAPGDRLGVLASNTPEVAFLVHAAARSGIALVLLNIRLAADEWREQVARAGCKRVLVEASLSPGELGVPCEELCAPTLAPIGNVELAPDPAWPLALLFTSGTTGRPKAAMLSAGALTSHARASAQHLGTTPDDLHLCNLPLFHVGGLSMLFRAAACGGAVVLHPRFDAELVLRDLAERPVTHLSLVATSLARVLEALGDAPLRAPALRTFLLGGGPLPEILRIRATQKGLSPQLTYGLTEACSQVTTVLPGELSIAGGSSGRALPGVRVRVVDDARRELPTGEAGEVEVAGSTLMLGYHGDRLATRAALDGGWLRTRDLGTLDARGFLTVHARRSDLILSGGENVYPAELEAALLELPGVREAAVVARSDATWGQVPVAAVVLEQGFEVSSLAGQLERRLARYKQPKEILRLDALPRTASGKIAREALRALLGIGPAA